MDVQTTTTRYLGLKVKQGNDINPAFVERVPDKGRTYNTIEGYMSSAEIRDKTSGEEDVKEFIITLKDDQGETDIIDFRGNATGFSIIAGLASCDFTKPVKIRLKRVVLPDGVVARVDISQNGNHISWSPVVDDVPRYGPDRDLFLADVFKTYVIDRLSLGHG